MLVKGWAVSRGVSRWLGEKEGGRREEWNMINDSEIIIWSFKMI